MCRADCSCGLSCPRRQPQLPEGVHLLRAGQDQSGKTIKFEGGAYGAGCSFFAVSVEPGVVPGLHIHPYCEIWVVRRGRAAFQAGGQEIMAGPGDILVVQASVPHKFTSIGEERLDMVCIHDSGNIIQHCVDG